MTTNFRRTANWLSACGKFPSVEAASLQIGCDIEEQVEFLEMLNIDDPVYENILKSAINYLTTVAQVLKRLEAVASVSAHNRVHALDALCDREVTGNGVAYLLGFNKEIADLEVLRSNDAKLVGGKPVILEGGKIGKPPGWAPPNLEELV